VAEDVGARGELDAFGPFVVLEADGAGVGGLGEEGGGGGVVVLEEEGGEDGWGWVEDSVCCIIVSWEDEEGGEGRT